MSSNVSRKNCESDVVECLRAQRIDSSETSYAMVFTPFPNSIIRSLYYIVCTFVELSASLLCSSNMVGKQDNTSVAINNSPRDCMILFALYNCNVDIWAYLSLYS